jgi:hypothetical protein
VEYSFAGMVENNCIGVKSENTGGLSRQVSVRTEWHNNVLNILSCSRLLRAHRLAQFEHGFPISLHAPQYLFHWPIFPFVVAAI